MGLGSPRAFSPPAAPSGSDGGEAAGSEPQPQPQPTAPEPKTRDRQRLKRAAPALEGGGGAQKQPRQAGGGNQGQGQGQGDLREAVGRARSLSPLSAAPGEQIRQHIRDVRREVFLRPLLALVARLMFHRSNHGLFNVRVDPVRWNIPHYLEVVKRPMDLSAVKNKCLNLEYASADACADDVRLVFRNACLFNPPGHAVHEAAKELLREFEAEYARLVAKQQALNKRRDEHSCPFCLANVCAICNEKCINFEPPFVQCSGPCRQRIKRHSLYYKTPSGSHHWCAKCHTSLPKVLTLPVAPAPGDEQQQQQQQPTLATVPKNTLIKGKFLDQLTEPWVQCDKCSGWVHQICVLFNACENAGGEGEDVPYTCPLCRLKELDEEKENWDCGMPPSLTSVDEFPLAPPTEKFDFGQSHSPALKLRKLISTDFVRVLGFDKDIHKRIAGYCCSSDSVQGDSTQIVRSRDLADCALSRFMQDWVYRYLASIGEVDAADSVVIKVASSIKKSCLVSPVVRQHFRSEKVEVRHGFLALVGGLPHRF